MWIDTGLPRIIVLKGAFGIEYDVICEINNGIVDIFIFFNFFFFVSLVEFVQLDHVNLLCYDCSLFVFYWQFLTGREEDGPVQVEAEQAEQIGMYIFFLSMFLSLCKKINILFTCCFNKICLSGGTPVAAQGYLFTTTAI